MRAVFSTRTAGVKFRAPCYLATSFRLVLCNAREIVVIIAGCCTQTPSCALTNSKETAEQFRKHAAAKGEDTIMWRIEVRVAPVCPTCGVHDVCCDVTTSVAHIDCLLPEHRCTKSTRQETFDYP